MTVPLLLASGASYRWTAAIGDGFVGGGDGCAGMVMLTIVSVLAMAAMRGAPVARRRQGIQVNEVSLTVALL